MSSFFSTIRQLLGTPLDRMKFTGAGTHGLPVEIWDYIYTLACSAVVYPALIQNELQDTTSIGAYSFCESQSIISDYHETRRPALFQLRYNLVLVCRSWYYMAISMLYSHVRFNLNDSDKHESLRIALVRSRSLAYSVVRLSMDGLAFYPGDVIWRGDRGWTFREITAMLPNLRIVGCPHNIARGFESHLRPEVAVIHLQWKGKDSIYGGPSLAGTHFWQNCHTLSYSMLNEPQLPLPVQMLKPNEYPTFPNLINLQLVIDGNPAVPWIKQLWNLPRIRSLSLSTRDPGQWLEFVHQFRLSLERLEILLIDRETNCYRWTEYSMRYPVDRTEPINFPKLKALCLPIPIAPDQDILQPWFNGIQAPRLTRFCVHILTMVVEDNRPNFLRQVMPTVPRYYPSVKVLAVRCHDPYNSIVEDIKPHIATILSREDLVKWGADGMIIEVTNKGGKNKMVYTKEAGLIQV